MSYQILLLDADGTLLDFQRAEAQALEETFHQHGLYFDETVLSDYSKINKTCWEEFEQGLLDKKTLLIERFRRLFETYGIAKDPTVVRLTYQEELGKGAFLIPDALSVCRTLSRTHDLYIVTNGVAATQYSRFRDSGLTPLMKGLFISEEIGYQKPQKEFFDYVLEHIVRKEGDHILMVGDSLSADMKGGILAGLDTCWYNPSGIKRPSDMDITYEIQDIRELLTIACR